MARTGDFIRWLLVVAALTFFAVQLKMFVSQTSCAEQMEKAVENEEHWAAVARGLQQNLTASQGDIQALRRQLVEMHKSYQGALEALQNATAEVKRQQLLLLQSPPPPPPQPPPPQPPPPQQQQQQQPPPQQQQVVEVGEVRAEAKQAVPEGTAEEKVLLEEGKQLPPGLRELPPRLQLPERPATEGKAAEEPPLIAENKGQEAAVKLPPGLRGLPPRLQRQVNPAGDEGLSLAQTQNPAQQAEAQAGAEGSTVPAGEAIPQRPVVAAVVVMACNRADYLDRTLQSVLKYHDPVSGKFPLFISQDGRDVGARTKAQSYPQFLYMQHIEEKPPEAANPNEILAYYRIAEHYKWVLTQLFDVLQLPRVIILEDDMELAPDFFNYFEAMADLLDTDESLLAVSSWNDNGQRQFVQDPEMVYRSDFFPGLGWMLRKSLWDELRPKWPRAYWDDWLRLEANRKGRQTIRPEICRTFNFGEHGSSMGQFYRDYLAPIKLNQEKVEWARKDLNYLLDVNYPDVFAEALQAATKADSYIAVAEASELPTDTRLEYRDETQFREIARAFGIFQEWKDGVPRTAYQGVVVFRYKGPHKVFLTGPNSQELLAHKAAFSSSR